MGLVEKDRKIKRHTVEMEIGESITGRGEKKGEIIGNGMTHHRPEAHDC